MSHAEYISWVAFAEVEPLPAQRADIHTAMMMMLYATIHRGKKGKKLKLADLLPDWWQDKRSPRVLAAKLRALTATWGHEAKPVGETSTGEKIGDGRRSGELNRQAGP